MRSICKHLVAGIVLYRSEHAVLSRTSNSTSPAWVSVGQVMLSLNLSRNTAKRYLFAACDDGLIETKPGPTARVGWLFRPRRMTAYARDYLLGVDALWYISRMQYIEETRVNWSAFEHHVSQASMVDTQLQSREFTIGSIPRLTTHGTSGIVFVDTEQGENPTGGPLPEMSGIAT